jgi:hypothetical protein
VIGKRKAPRTHSRSPKRHNAMDPGQVKWFVWIRVNDPSAGSPTETLLRLLLPLSDKVH